MLEKFNRIKMKKVFYTELSKRTGTSFGTIRSHWFNLQKGIHIPTEHEKDTEAVLDWSLLYESKIKEVNQKFGI
jgi:hypothetical protein